MGLSQSWFCQPPTQTPHFITPVDAYFQRGLNDRIFIQHEEDSKICRINSNFFYFKTPEFTAGQVPKTLY